MPRDRTSLKRDLEILKEKWTLAEKAKIKQYLRTSFSLSVTATGKVNFIYATTRASSILSKARFFHGSSCETNRNYIDSNLQQFNSFNLGNIAADFIPYKKLTSSELTWWISVKCLNEYPLLRKLDYLMMISDKRRP